MSLPTGESTSGTSEPVSQASPEASQGSSANSTNDAQAVLQNAAQLPFSEVVKFAQAFGLSLDELGRNIAQKSGFEVPNVIRSTEAHKTSIADEKVYSANARHEQQFNEHDQHELKRRQQQAEHDRSFQSGDTGMRESRLSLEQRIEKLEMMLGQMQANRLGDPSLEPKAQVFRDMPIKDALELVYYRIGPSFMEAVLPLEEATPLIEQVQRLREALAALEGPAAPSPPRRGNPAASAPSQPVARTIPNAQTQVSDQTQAQISRQTAQDGQTQVLRQNPQSQASDQGVQSPSSNQGGQSVQRTKINAAAPPPSQEEARQGLH